MDNRLMEHVQMLLQKIESDEELKKQFQENPLEAIKALTGVEIPAETVEGLSNSVKEKLGEDGFDKLVGSVKDML